MSISNETLVTMIKSNVNAKENTGILYTQNRRLIYRLIHKFMNNPDNIEDYMQTAYFGLLGAIKAYTPDKGYKFTTYLSYHIRTAIKRLDYNEPIKALSLDSPLTHGEDITLADTIEDIEAQCGFISAENSTVYDIVRNEIDKLLPECRVAIYGRFWYEQSYAEIAKANGVGIGMVKSNMEKALRVLRCNKRIRKLGKEYFTPRHVGIHEFKSTWTSSTELAALKRLERQGAAKVLLRLLNSVGG